MRHVLLVPSYSLYLWAVKKGGCHDASSAKNEMYITKMPITDSRIYFAHKDWAWMKLNMNRRRCSGCIFGDPLRGGQY